MSNDWTDKLRDRLTDYQEPVTDDLWDGIEQSLAHIHEPAVSEPSRGTGISSRKARQVFIRRFSMAAALAALAIGGTYVYLHPWDDKNVGKVVSDITTPQAALRHESNAGTSTDAFSRVGNTLAKKMLAFKNMSTGQEILAQASESNASVMPLSAEGQSLLAEHEGDKEHEVETRQPARSVRNDQTGMTSFDVSQTKRKRYFSSVTMKLYGENGIVGNLSNNSGQGNGRPMSDSPAFFDNGDPTLMSAYNSLLYAKDFHDFSGTGYTETHKHHQPLSVGLSVGIPLSSRLKLTTGLVYTKTSSDFIGISGSSEYVTTQTLHYVGIPLDLSYYVWGTNRFHTYVTVGGEGAYNVKNHTVSDGEEVSSRRDRMQWSIHGAVGAQYDVIPQLGVYIEPGVKNYFDNGSTIENVFKDKKLNFNFQFGLRWNLGEK